MKVWARQFQGMMLDGNGDLDPDDDIREIIVERGESGNALTVSRELFHRLVTELGYKELPEDEAARYTDDSEIS